MNLKIGIMKSALLTIIASLFAINIIAQEQGYDVVLEGSNADDLHDYRPGRQAIAELGIISPLCEAGLTKDEIRQLSQKASLPTATKSGCRKILPYLCYSRGTSYLQSCLFQHISSSLSLYHHCYPPDLC